MTLAVITKECQAQDHRHCPGLVYPPDPRVPDGQPSLPCECKHHIVVVRKPFGQR